MSKKSTTTIGMRIVEEEQKGKERAGYGEKLLNQLASDLTTKFGRGFSRQNLQRMRQFYIKYPPDLIRSTLSSESKQIKKNSVVHINQINLEDLAHTFSLSWSHYVMLLSLKKDETRSFYETEALRGGWSVRQLDWQISSQFYERTLLSRNKAAMLKKGSKQFVEDLVTAEEEIKDPLETNRKILT